MFELDSTDAYGGFNGVKVDYAKLLSSYSDSPEMVKQLELMGFTEEYMKKFTEKFKDFQVTLLVGNYGDYVVIYFGDTAEGLKFTDQVSDSLLANEEISFLNEYKDKEAVSVTYVSKEISEELAKVNTMMEDLSAGMNKFLTETKSLGDTTKIQALLKKVAVNGKKLNALTSPSRFGSVAYLEDGFKMDSFHGSESVMYDLDTKRRLAGVAHREDVVLSSNWVLKAENTELVIQNLEDVVNLVYQTAQVAVEQDIEDRDFREFSEMFKLVDTQFSDDLADIWKSTRQGMREGLGNEGAMVIDLKGKMTKVSDMPAVLLENGEIPRLAIGYDVVDRNKLADSWKEIDLKIWQVISKLETLTNEKVNYETAELTKKEGIDFWSYPLDITSHESNLAVGINEEMMFFNTSPAMIEGLMSGYDADGQLGGMVFKFRMASMREYARGWIELVDKHGSELSPTFEREEFIETKVLLDEILKVSEEIESLDFSMKKEDGEVRSYFHLNKRN